jgi:hypothetical protein
MDIPQLQLEIILTLIFVTGFLFVACRREGKSMGSLMKNVGVCTQSRSQIPSSE